MPNATCVLILTHPFDPTADYVVEALHRIGTPVFRCDVGDFPQRLTMAASIGSEPTGWLRLEARELRLENVRCAYYRRPTFFDFPEGMSGPERKWANREARAGFGGVLSVLPRWLNHPHRIAYSEYKPVQLTHAIACGLDIPATLITNDPDEAARFTDATRRVVYKPVSASTIAEDSRHRVIFTTKLDATVDFDSAAHTAHLFQEWIPKQYEVRLTVVDDDFFPVRIDAHSEDSAIDWRTDFASLTYSETSLPEPVRSAVGRFMRVLGLRFGAFDFIVTADDRWVFLEVNPNGQWAWIEDQTGLLISDSIASALSKET